MKSVFSDLEDTLVQPVSNLIKIKVFKKNVIEIWNFVAEKKNVDKWNWNYVCVKTNWIGPSPALVSCFRFKFPKHNISLQNELVKGGKNIDLVNKDVILTFNWTFNITKSSFSVNGNDASSSKINFWMPRKIKKFLSGEKPDISLCRYSLIHLKK